MKKVYRKIIAFCLLLALCLPCLSGCFVLFGGGDTSSSEAPKLSYDGHYLVDLLDPVDWSKTIYGDCGNAEIYEADMANEHYYKGIKFVGFAEKERAYLEYDLEGKYENISFFYGKDSAHKYSASYSVSFQIIDPTRNNAVVWESLFKCGDIPRFATVNVSGLHRIQLACYAVGIINNFHYDMMEITLWEGESEAKDRSYPKITPTTDLGGDYPFFYGDQPMTMNPINYHNFAEGSEKSINGKKYSPAARLSFGSDNNLYMNLKGRFKQISFTLGLDDESTYKHDNFKGYLSIYADGACVLDEFICGIETPVQTIILDVDYAWQLRFVIATNNYQGCDFVIADLTGGESLGQANMTDVDKNIPVPMVQNHYPYAVAGVGMGTYVKVYNSTSRYYGFYMGGNKYIEGIVLAPVWNLLDSTASPAYAVSDLENKYKYLTFTAGHIDDAAYKPAVLEIYLDGEAEPSYKIPIKDTDLPKEYTIDVKNCRTIKFFCTGNAEQNLPVIGLANIVAYPEEVEENDLFPPFYEEYPATCELTDYFRPFGYFSYGLSKIYYDDGIDDDGKYFETYDGKRHKKGLLFCTHIGLNWDGIGWLMAIIPDCILTESREEDKNSFFAFNINGEYDTLTFSTAEAVRSDSEKFTMLYNEPVNEGRQELQIFGDSDEKCLYWTELLDDTVQTHTVDITGVKRLIFCMPSNGSIMSEVFSAFDIKLTKNSEE